MAKKFKIRNYVLKIKERDGEYDTSALDEFLENGWKVKNFSAASKFEKLSSPQILYSDPKDYNYVVFYLQKRVNVED